MAALVSAIAAAPGAVGSSSAAPAAGTAGTAAGEVPVLTFRAKAVDGVDVLVLRDATAWVEHRQWAPIERVRLRVHRPFPRDGRHRLRVRRVRGRALVRVLEQPRASNGFVARIRIDDRPIGAAPLSFELVAEPDPSPPHPYNIVLVTIDSLRPDRLGCYGYGRPTSPNLDAFARESLRFERAFSTSSFTPPAHASLLTSRYVGDHGLLTWNALADEQLTLAEVLEARGYRTGASVAIPMLSEQGLGQGFAWRREGFRDGREVVDDALEFLRSGDEVPFLLWLHLYDVHRPYARVPGWEALFGSHGRPEVGAAERFYNLRPADVARLGLDGSDLRYVEDRYDAGIAYEDAQLGPLLAELRTPARRADTLVIITADHGESLRDHASRLFTHDPFLYSAVTRVPLLIRYPGGRGAGKVSGQVVSLIDVAPTVLALLGLDAPGSFEGRSLLGLEAGRALDRDGVFHECWGWEELKALRTRDRLVLRDLADDSTVFFDLRSDPGERHPLRQPPDGRARALAARLEAFVRRAPERGAPELPAALRERLEALGYADGAEASP